MQLRLIQEYPYTKLSESIKHGESGADRNFLLLIDYVPCILHMENRTGLKLLTLVLQEGISNIYAKTIYSHISHDGPRMTFFLTKIEEACNEKIWGTTTRPTAWKVPFNWKDKKLDDITLT